MTREKKLRVWTGAALAVATLATRLPIHSRTFFEFDSINFAVATFRFDLSQVTPQIPGYILHVLFGRLLYLFTGDLNLAYIWVSILLSIGSVLFLWRAAAVLRGERVGIIAALLWLTTPLFWFHGAVNAIYAEEAFVTSLLLYLGFRAMESRDRGMVVGSTRFVTLLLPYASCSFLAYFIAFSLSGAARPTSLLFCLPATIFLIRKRNPSRRLLWAALICFSFVTGIWLSELFRESGGIVSYWSALIHDNNFRTQSILFGNSWKSQLDTIEKAVFYFIVALGPTWLLVFSADIFFARRSWEFIKTNARNSKGQFVFLVAVVPMLFYLLVFFMKAGYLLDVLPSAILVRAVLLDQSAIWIAERQKRRAKDKNLLTRPLITRNVITMISATVLLNVLWFFVPWPGTAQRIYDNEDTRNSFIHGAMHRYEHSESRALTLANRAFEYTNISGIRAVDSLNDMTMNALLANHGNDSGEVLLASWWYRWCYLLMPRAVTYDLELDPIHAGALWVGRSQDVERQQITDSVIQFHSSAPVLLLMRHDRPDFEEVARQVHLERLPLPEYLDIYKIEDTTFVLKWGNRTFISR